jgi:hypothetical protein
LRLLEITESPFLGSDGFMVRPADLGAALAILNRPWRKALWLIAHPFFWRLAASWHVWRSKSWTDDAQKLSEYFEECLWAPECYREDGERDDSNVFGFASSFSMRIAWKLSAGHPPTKNSKVWDLSIIEALAWSVTAAELSGRGFVTRDEVELVEKQVAEQVKAEAEKAVA